VKWEEGEGKKGIQIRSFSRVEGRGRTKKATKKGVTSLSFARKKKKERFRLIYDRGKGRGKKRGRNILLLNRAPSRTKVWGGVVLSPTGGEDKGNVRD